MGIMNDEEWRRILKARRSSRREQIKTHKLVLSVYLLDYCNLNCHACSRWCNISKHHRIYKYDNICSDMLKILSSTHYTQCIGYNGGEPLLHPDIVGLVEFLGEVSKKFNIGFTSISTNLKKLLKMPDEFFKAVREGGIRIVYSLYPGVDINYRECFKRLDDEHIPYDNFTEIDGQPADAKRDDFIRTQLVLPPKHDSFAGFLSFTKCGGVCPNIWMGNIYKCCNLAFIQTVNDNYNTDIHATGDDFMSVDDYTEDKYFEWLAKPSNFCKNYCHRTNIAKEDWHVGKTTKEELILYKNN